MASAPTSRDVSLKQTAYLLGEHLDMILAAAEDLKAVRATPRPTDPRRLTLDPRLCLQQYVEDLYVCELSAISRAQRAREHTRAAVRQDKRLAMLGGLFVAGTAALSDAVAEMADLHGLAFETGGDPLRYLVSRGVIEQDAGLPEDISSLQAGDTFRIAGVIELGPLCDLCATFLDTLDRHFDVFPETDAQANENAEPAAVT